MKKNQKCEHDWEKKETRVRPDNPRFNHQYQFMLLIRVCSKCKRQESLDYYKKV